MKRLLVLLMLVFGFTCVFSQTIVLAENYDITILVEPVKNITSTSAQIDAEIIVGEKYDDKPMVPGYVYMLQYWEEGDLAHKKNSVYGSLLRPHKISAVLTDLKPNTTYNFDFSVGVYVNDCSGSFTTKPSSTIGDLNGDSKVNSSDFALLRRYILEITADIITENADINTDGKINSTDYAVLKRIILGLILNPAEDPTQVPTPTPVQSLE